MKKIYQRYRFRKLDKDEYKLFRQSLKEAREFNKHGDFVLLRDESVYAETENFLLGNGIAGFAIYDGEMISVFKNPTKAERAEVKLVLPKIVRCAFKHGAQKGDCYGEFLANYYMQSGFLPVAYVPFDYMEDNPVDWDELKFGKPNTYIMMRAVKTVEILEFLVENNRIVCFDEIKTHIKKFTNYDKALAYRDELLNNMKSYSYLKMVNTIKEM